MKALRNLSSYFVVAIILGAAGVGAWSVWGTNRRALASDSVIVPVLSADAAMGKVAFDHNCAKCHGVNAAGTKKGPPFINQIYNPGHHSDAAFFYAAENGVRQHHWPYGDMPPQPQVTKEEIRQIVEYVRALQQANGIVWRAHTM